MKKLCKRKKYMILVILAIAIAIILVVAVVAKAQNRGELKLDEFEKVAIYGYLEDNVIDATTVYKKVGLVDELQLFQTQLKQTLDTYFKHNSEKVVSTSVILGMMESKYIPDNIDFNGIVISGYEFDSINNTLKKHESEYQNMNSIEEMYNDTEYINKTTKIKKIQKNKDGMYVVTFDIIDKNMPDESNVDISGEAVLKIDKNIIAIEECTLNK